MDQVQLADRRCPCAVGWTCDTKTGLCVLGGRKADDAGVVEIVPNRMDSGVLVSRNDAAPPPMPPDDAGGPRDASAPPDADTAAEDAKVPVDTGVGITPDIIEYYRAASCSPSAPALGDCRLTTDGNHGTSIGHECVQGDGVCSFSEGCATEGCIQDAWLAMDLGAARTVSRARFAADWWSKRPKDYEIWVSDSPSDVPFAGARLVAAGIGSRNPWRCVAGDSCADTYVPDVCCPNGRDAPQAPLDTLTAKYDILDFEPSAGRYWYLVVRNTYSAPNLAVAELEFGGPSAK